MDSILILGQLFYTFFIIGVFTFGGGYAMLSLIQGQVVTQHQWISESTFTDIVAISQMTPGPIGVNCATYVGYEVFHSAGASFAMSFLGSFVATFALALPSFIIVLMMVKFYQKFMGNSIFDGVMSGLRPAVVGLIGAAAVILIVDTKWTSFAEPHFEVIKENFTDWKSWILFAASFIGSMFFKINPILIIILGGVAGFLLY